MKFRMKTTRKHNKLINKFRNSKTPCAFGFEFSIDL